MTAEWLCTACGASNRRLVHEDDREVHDRCFTCKTAHVIEPSDRPVYWRARAA